MFLLRAQYLIARSFGYYESLQNQLRKFLIKNVQNFYLVAVRWYILFIGIRSQIFTVTIRYLVLTFSAKIYLVEVFFILNYINVIMGTFPLKLILKNQKIHKNLHQPNFYRCHDYVNIIFFFPYIFIIFSEFVTIFGEKLCWLFT